jgi:hypothetical protein
MPAELLADDSIKIAGRTPRELQALLWYSTQCWASQMLKSHINSPQKAFFLLCKGLDLGLPATAAWDMLYPTQSGAVGIMKQAALAVIQKCPSYGGYREWIENEGTPQMRAVATAWRKGTPENERPIKEFTLEHAKTAGLLVKPRRRDTGKEYDGTYQSYLGDMLLARAASRVMKIAFAAELAGCQLEGEAEDADDRADRRGQVKVTTQGAAAALQGPAQRLLAPPPKRDPILEELRATPRADPELVPATLVPEKTPEVQAVIDQQIDEVFGAAEKACPRCKAGLNAMEGCDVCGWPGEDDFRE